MNLEPYYFPQQGVIKFNFTDEELQPIKDEINYIKNNMANCLPANNILIGHLDNEFYLEKTKKYISNLVFPSMKKYVEIFGFPYYTKNILTKDVNLTIDNVWVNFQKKHEFNPLHHHCGVFSFVIWIKTPYTKKDERQVFDLMEEHTKKNGSFVFSYNSMLGYIVDEVVYADKNFEGSGFLFPSSLNHAVYPFYTSDEYRISVSGNFKFEV